MSFDGSWQRTGNQLRLIPKDVGGKTNSWMYFPLQCGVISTIANKTKILFWLTAPIESSKLSQKKPNLMAWWIRRNPQKVNQNMQSELGNDCSSLQLGCLWIWLRVRKKN